MTTFAKSSKGEFKKASLSASLVIKAGDLVQQVGNQIVVIRNGQVVSTANISATTTVQPTAASHPDVINHVVFFRSNPVPGQSVVLQGVSENQNTGVVTFAFSNGNSREFSGGWSDVGSQLGVMDQDSVLAENILMLKSYRNSPDGTDKLTMVDVNCAVNFDAGTPIALIEV